MLDSICTSDPLTSLERQYVLLTQNGLPIVPKPFNWLASELNISVEQVLEMTRDFTTRGIVRRIAAVPNHYKLGYKFNGMTVWDIDDVQAKELGTIVGQLPFVSHCYLRPRFLPKWNYNLFAMVHGKSTEEISDYRKQIKEILKEALVVRSTHDSNQGPTLRSNDMLTSTKILKKTGLRLKRKS